jgi:hypothetical protein
MCAGMCVCIYALTHTHTHTFTHSHSLTHTHIHSHTHTHSHILTHPQTKMKNFLIAGQLLKKHSKSALPRPRHVYVTNDLQHFIWKDPKKSVEPEVKMKVGVA